MGGAYHGVGVQGGEEVGGVQAVVKATEEGGICIKGEGSAQSHALCM